MGADEVSVEEWQLVTTTCHDCDGLMLCECNTHKVMTTLILVVFVLVSS
jgi:hypothetical protein